MSDTRDFSDVTDESSFDDSKLNASFCNSPVALDKSDGHNVSIMSELSALNAELSETNSSMFFSPQRLFSISSMLSSESPYLDCETRENAETLKKVLSEVNEAHAHWLESEFMLQCCMGSMHKLPKEIALKMKEVVLDTKLKKLPRIKSSKSGESFSVFGLEEDELERMGDHEKDIDAHHSSTAINNFSQLEKNAIKRAVRDVAKLEIEKLTERISSMHDQFGSHCQRVAGSSGLLSDDQERLQEMYRFVPDKMAETVDQLISINQLLQQLARPDKSGQELLAKTTSLVRERAECLHTLTSYLNLKVDQQMLKDWKYVKSVNEEGDKLKSAISERDLELKSLQKRLDQFTALENSSSEFRELVDQYNKTKRILKHKIQTLKMCDESNDSFSKS